MELERLIARMRERYDGFNEPAVEADLNRLQRVVGPLRTT